VKNSSLGSFAIFALSAVLLTYTAWRTFDVISMSVPASHTEIAIVGIAGIDGAVIGWTLFRLFGAKGDWHYTISTVMIMVGLVGILISVLGDTLVRLPGTEPPDYLVAALWWGIPVIIWMNVAAFILVHLTDPTHVVDRAKRDVHHAIEQAVARILQENAESYASEVAPDVAAQRAAEVKRQILHSVTGRRGGKPATTFASETKDIRPSR